MKDMVKLAKEIATKAHRGQVDKSKKEYINHPAMVASLVKLDEEKIVAWLHDVVEDTSITLTDLRKNGFSDDVITAIDLITKKDNVPYEKYIENLKVNKIAINVKIADLTHNSDLTRITNPGPKDILRTEKYLKTIKLLNDYQNSK